MQRNPRVERAQAPASFVLVPLGSGSVALSQARVGTKRWFERGVTRAVQGCAGSWQHAGAKGEGLRECNRRQGEGHQR